MEPDEETTFVGYGPAATYLGLKRNTLSSYVTKGTGPVVYTREISGQYVLPVFRRKDLDSWVSERKGQGFRSDLEAAKV